MKPIYWRLGLTLVVGVVSGLIGGQATVAGLVQPTPASRDLRVDSRSGDRGYGPGSYGDANPDMADQTRIASACEDCSDYDLGFRFAASRHLKTTADCMDYSWSYQRGCLAYLRDS